MLDLSILQKIGRNPSFGLIPMFIFSIIIRHMDSRIAVIIALILSLIGSYAIKKHSKLIYHVSSITFGLALLLSFSTLAGLPYFNKFVIVEVIFVLTLIISRLSRGRIAALTSSNLSLMSKSFLKETLKVAFQTQYGVVFHLLLFLLYIITGPQTPHLVNSAFITILLQVILGGIIMIHTLRLYILEKKLFKEEWLPVIDESGGVTGRVAKSITKGLKNKFMHPVVRVALLFKGSIYLRERDQSRLLNPGKLDFPFEKYMEYKDNIENTVRHSLGENIGNKNIPLRYTLKYTFENEITKRLIILYVSEIEDEDLFNSLDLNEGKLWSSAQIEDNISSGIFSECFELEFEYLKNTVLLAYQYRKKSANE